MKIVHVCKYFFPRITGVTIYVENLGRELVRQGHEVIVITWGDQSGAEIFDGLKVVRVEPGNRKGLVRAIEQENPDRIHSHGIWEHTPLAAIAAIKGQVPYFVTVHGTWIFLEKSPGMELRWRRFKYLQLYKKTLWRWVIKKAAGVIVLNYEEKQDVRRSGVSIDRIFRIPNGIDPLTFVPGDSLQSRKSLGLEDRPTVLFVGAIQKQKGIFTLLSAALKISIQKPEVQWICCGEGPHRKEAEAWVIDNDLVDKVFFLGKVERESIVDYYQAADIFVLPSHMEAFATVYLEAMGVGLPCIGTSVGGTPEIILEGETGYLIGREDEAALVERVLSLVENPEKIQVMGRAARKRVLDRFSWETISQSIENLYGR